MIVAWSFELYWASCLKSSSGKIILSLVKYKKVKSSLVKYFTVQRLKLPH